MIDAPEKTITPVDTPNDQDLDSIDPEKSVHIRQQGGLSALCGDPNNHRHDGCRGITFNSWDESPKTCVCGRPVCSYCRLIYEGWRT